jgi:CubicO group peptidase (beta-lactamase class C family)
MLTTLRKSLNGATENENMADTTSTMCRVTRRAALRWLGALLAGARGLSVGRAAAQASMATPLATPTSVMSDAVIQGFVADIEAAQQTFGVTGAAVALVQDDRIVLARGFGVRDLQRRLPVTEHTRFRIASNTKSMTSFLVATFVDEGVLRWDDRVVDVWPDFRAPTAELTSALRVRDLLGMGSGIAESPTIEFFMIGGGESPLDVLRSVAYLPVIGPPQTVYYYNNTLACVAGYLGSLAQGTAPEELGAAYAALLAKRLFTPAGMADAAIADDPRPLGEDYAIGYAHDLFGRATEVPFVSINGVAPAGSGLASAMDMAHYLIMQMHGGVAADGGRLVSAANLAQTHAPGIVVPPDVPNALPSLVLADTTVTHYCLGWFEQTFKDGRRLLWNAGGIDGFVSLMGFFPAEKIGFALLTNAEPGGALFTISVQSSLLSRLFGLNQTAPGILAGLLPESAKFLADLAAQTRPVDPTAAGPYLGLYEQGFRVRLDDAGELRLDHDIRSMPLLGLADGGYVVTSGPSMILGRKVHFTGDAATQLTMIIEGFEPVRWLTAA